jgi:predicted ATPase
MFYPLIEHEIKDLPSDIQLGSTPQERPSICVLIDEPELPLHPNLQFKVMDYLRVLSTGQNVQVILATHSPTIVEYASFEELYLFRPIELVGANENQLVRIADKDEPLQLLGISSVREQT